MTKFTHPDYPNLIYNTDGPSMMTVEGPAVYQEAIDFLKEQEPLGIQTWNHELYLAAKAHTDDIGPKGMVQHDSSDGTSFGDRTRQYFTEGLMMGENLAFGSQQAGYDPVAPILQLIVDDGVPNRGHRTAFFNTDFT